MYIGSKKFDKQIDYAVKEHYSHVIIMGASELESNIVKIKNLDTREEAVADIASVAEFFKNA